MVDDRYPCHGAGADLHRPVAQHRTDEVGRLVSGDIDGGDGNGPHCRTDPADAACFHRRRYQHHSHPVRAAGVSDDARKHATVEHRYQDLGLGLGPDRGGAHGGVHQPADGADGSPPGAHRRRHHLSPRAPPAGRGGARDTPGLLPRWLAPCHGDRTRGRVLPPRAGRNGGCRRSPGPSLRHRGCDAVPPSGHSERTSGARPDPGPARNGTDPRAPENHILPQRLLVAHHLRGDLCAHGVRGRRTR